MIVGRTPRATATVQLANEAGEAYLEAHQRLSEGI